MSNKISEEIIRLAYMFFLNRNPENSKSIKIKQNKYKNIGELREKFLKSEEFFKKTKHLFFAKILDMHVEAKKLDIDVSVIEDLLNRLFNKTKMVWTKLGKDEPYWSVLTSNRYKCSEIGQNSIDQFYKTGKKDVGLIELALTRNNININRLKSCLEYGCGIGRMTIWLAGLFSKVIALDFSRSHLDFLKIKCLEKEIKNIDTFHLKSVEGLDDIESIDLIISLLTLQHNPPPVLAYIIDKLLKKLNHRGVAIFNVPSYRENYEFKIEDYLDKLQRLERKKEQPKMEMHILPQKKVFEIVEEAKCSVIEVIRDKHGAWTGFISTRYFVQKK